MPRPSFLRLLSPVEPDAQILWGVPVKALEVNRFLLRKDRGEGRVPYVVVSERRAVRVVEEGTLGIPASWRLLEEASNAA